jgi:hypothetical protein
MAIQDIFQTAKNKASQLLNNLSNNPKSSNQWQQQDQSEQQKQILNQVKERVDSVNNDVQDRIDTINLAYFRGQQWITWDMTNKMVVVPPKPSDQTRYVGNRLMKIVRTEKAKIQKNRVQMNVIPASTDQDDIEAAKMSDKVIDWLEYTKKLQVEDDRLLDWGLTTSITYMHPYWNPSLGELADESGLMTGDIDFDVLSCFEMKIDPAATCWRDVGWACKIKTRTVEYIESVYGVKVQPESDINTNNLYSSKMAFAPLLGTVKTTPVDNAARVHDYWEKPTKQYPKGRHIIYVQSQILYMNEDIGFGDEDTTERILPFFPFVHVKIPGSVTGTNMVEQLIPLQREYNRCRSQIIDNKDKMAYPKWFYRPNSIDLNDLSGDPGGFVAVRDGAEYPHRDQPTAMSSDTFQNLEQIKEEFYFVSGQQEVSHGGAPADASGYAISLLLEQDDTTLAPSMESFLQCKQDYVGYALKIMRFRCIAPRLMRIVGRGEGVEMLSFQGSQMTSTDVRIQRGSVMQTSKSAKQAQIMSLVNSGILNPQEDKMKILQWLEFGSIDDIYNEAEQDTKQAKEEQLRWEQGQIEAPEQGVRDFFNHPVHLAEHNKFRKSKKYTTMPPELQAAIDAHCDMHNQFIQQEQQAQMAAQMPPQEAEPTPAPDPELPDDEPQSMGTPPNINKMMMKLGNGEAVGNSMEGAQS